MNCFLIMPYGNLLRNAEERERWDALHDEIREAVQTAGLAAEPRVLIEVIRGDREARPGEIVRGIVRDLVESELAVAVLTGHNPNVFYELGVRHAVRNNTILLAEREEDVPFDLRTQRLILYSTTTHVGIVRLRNDLKQAVFHAVHHLDGEPDNPVLRYLGDRVHRRAAAPEPGVAEELRCLRGLVEELIQHGVRPRDPESLRPGAGIDPQLPAGQKPDWKAFLGSWVSDSDGTHCHIQMVRGVPIALYCYGGNDGPTGIYHDLWISGEWIYGRFRWLEHPQICGYGVFLLDGSDRMQGGWWYDRDVPAEVRAGGALSDPDKSGIVPRSWRRLGTDMPRWACDWFAEAEATPRRFGLPG